MSDPMPTSSGVSKARKLVSTVLLFVLLVVLAIELRASVGYAWSGSALAAKSNQGILENTPHSEVKGMLKFWPHEEVISEEENQIEYRFSWFSLLAPLLSRDEPAYHVVMVSVGDAEGAVFDVESPNGGDVARLVVALHGADGPINDADFQGMGGPGGGFGDVGDAGFGAGGQRGGRPSPPSDDPLVTALDSDADGELSEAEIAKAVASLLKVDKNGDGVISADEARPVRPPVSGSGTSDRATRARRQRPPLEDE